MWTRTALPWMSALTGLCLLFLQQSGCTDTPIDPSPSPSEATPTAGFETDTPPNTAAITDTPSDTPDGGTPDGGTPDGGTPGTDTPGSGTPDGGTPDGGTPVDPTDPGGTIPPTVAPTPTGSGTATPDPGVTPTPGTGDLDHDGVTVAAGDCNDADGTVYPGATEVPYDGIDQDCSGADLVDVDGDTHVGEPAGGDDCDDTNQNTYPGAPEFADGQDNDCDGAVDEGLSITDDDGDGLSEAEGDCNDADGTTYPGADELPYDGIDQDCSGMDLIDVDGDGAVSVAVEGGTDCDDDNATVFPGASEVCDGLDNDCNGTSDDVIQPGWYQDSDGDSYGNAAVVYVGCSLPPAGYVQNATDCDDSSASVHPNATEVCNAIDDNCNGQIDEGVPDLDSDGIPNCLDSDADGDGVSVAGGDCNDLDAQINPTQPEVCDSVDQDCDGVVDEGALDAATWYPDADVDGFGDGGEPVDACSVPEGYLSDASDCDDTNDAVNPDATEVCDGIDNDCDGLSDDASAFDAVLWYADVDGDGYGNAASTQLACTAPAGYVADKTDCNDSASAIHPGALEKCDGIDNNCDGKSDDKSAWWNPAWPYRIPLTVTGSTQAVAGPPVTLDVDFDAMLDQLGDGGTLRPESIRVVLQDCSRQQPELPSQFLDAWLHLNEKRDDSDPVGNDRGTVAFLYDENGNYSSLESLPAGKSVSLAIYFGSTTRGSSIAAPSYTTGLSTTATQLSTGVAKATFAPEAGGMLSALTLGSSPSMMSQASSCCGNSTYMAGWNSDPQDSAGTLTLLEKGPVFAAIEATGTRTSSGGAYKYSYTYWMFAGRPELWSKVLEVTSAATVSDHPGDYTSGIRPWESQQSGVSGGATFTIDSKKLYADTSNGTWGVAWAYAKAPRYPTDATAYDPYLIVSGNDVGPAGTGASKSLPAGTAFMDNIVQVVLPHSGAFSTVSGTLQGLIAGATSQAAAPEKVPSP